MIRIGVIGSDTFGLYTKQIDQSHQFPEIHLSYLGDIRTSNIPELARQIKQGGFSVLVIGPMDHAVIAPYINTPCYIVHPTITDFLQLHNQIHDYSKSVVLFSKYYDIDFSILEESLHVKYNKRIYNREADLPVILRELKEAGITTVFGGRAVVDQAHLQDMEAFYYFRRTNLEDAIRNAIQISHNMEKELAYIEEIQSILENSMCGAILLSGPSAKISYANRTALNMLRRSLNDLLQRPIQEFVPSKISRHILSHEEAETDLQFTLCGVDVIGNIIRLQSQDGHPRICLLFENTSHILRYGTMIQQEIRRKSFGTRYSFNDIIGNSRELRRAITQAQRFARSNSTILINAETGAGKEVFAQSIHDYSPRHMYPFVAINCASIPDTLIESELFGYAPGAFTGASNKGKTGLVELANHGTVFLDDIDSLSSSFQAKLLRVMQEREIIRVGGNSPIPVDVRFIVATNKNLKTMVAEGTFRNDLYFRVNVLRLTIPPLRNRKEDILVLLAHYMRKFDEGIYEAVSSRLEEIFAPALSYDYPGNIRELISVTERFVSLVDPDTLDDTEELRQLVISCLDIDPEQVVQPSHSATTITGDYAADLAQAEHEILTAYLNRHNGSMTELARQLGISRTTLYNKLKDKTDH